jgi:integrase
MRYSNTALALSRSGQRGGWFICAKKRAGPPDPRPAPHRREPRNRFEANVKAVQRTLGHASAAMTLDVYFECGGNIPCTCEA